MNDFDKLTALFKLFPGIGPRQAGRFVYFLLNRDSKFVDELSDLILKVRKGIRRCVSCRQFFPIRHSGKGGDLCGICADSGRDRKILMVVLRDIDLENVEKSRSYHGLYFVLGGPMPILDKNPDQNLGSDELLKLVKTRQKDGLHELILALDATAEGEHTAFYLNKILTPVLKETGVKITTLGRGLSTGTELEYSDSETIKNALKNRT
jgi:recombination protein RecR